MNYRLIVISKRNAIYDSFKKSRAFVFVAMTTKKCYTMSCDAVKSALELEMFAVRLEVTTDHEYY